MISPEDLAFAIDNSTPYPIELTSDVCAFMAQKLLEFCVIEKNDADPIWQPVVEDPPPGSIEVPEGSPPGGPSQGG